MVAGSGAGRMLPWMMNGVAPAAWRQDMCRVQFTSEFEPLRLLLSVAVQGFVEYLGVDLGELFAPAGLLPSDFLYDEGDNEVES